MRTLPKTMNLEGHGKVEVLKTGHFPDTVMVRTKDGLEFETAISSLT